MLGQTITLLVTIALALNGATAAADDGHGVPLTFSGFHDDQYGKFSSWSSVISRGPNQITLEYAVCNFDVKVPLIYEWTGPNFGVGRGGTLPSGKCNILDRDVTAYDADTNAVIKFTQAGRAQPASAHVSKPPIDSRYLPPFIRNRLRAFYGPEGQTSQPSLADLQLVQSPYGDMLQSTISWFPPTVMIAIPVAAFGSQDRQGVIERIEKGGYGAKVSGLKDMLDETDRDRIQKDRLETPVIVIGQGPTSPTQLELLLDGKVKSVSSAFVTLMDRGGRLIVDTEVSIYLTK